MSPNRVARPVAVTSASAVPLTIEVPRKIWRSSSSPAALFSTGQRLAGQRRLLDVKILRLEETGVRGHEVAGGQPHPVSHDEIPARDPGPRAVPQRRRRRRHLAPEALGRALGSKGLDEVERDRQQDHGGDEHGVDDLPQDRRDRRRRRAAGGRADWRARREPGGRRPTPSESRRGRSGRPTPGGVRASAVVSPAGWRLVRSPARSRLPFRTVGRTNGRRNLCGQRRSCGAARVP